MRVVANSKRADEDRVDWLAAAGENLLREEYMVYSNGTIATILSLSKLKILYQLKINNDKMPDPPPLPPHDYDDLAEQSLNKKVNS